MLAEARSAAVGMLHAVSGDEAIASTEGMGDYKALVEQGVFKRQFRDHRLEWIIKSGGIQVVLDGLARDNIRFTGPLA